MPCQARFVRAGATSHNAIAAKLNERNVRTAHMYRSEQSFTLSTAPAKQVADSSLPIRYSAWCRLSPTISRNNKEKLNEDAHESTCNRRAGGRRHDRKCAVRKPHSPVRTNGRGRQFAQRHPGRERNKADRNYRPGHEEGCEEGCQDSAEAQSQSGVRKPHSAVRSRGRRRPTAALNR
jgi:hypothetical protein